MLSDYISILLLLCCWAQSNLPYILAKDSTFCGVECTVENLVEHEVDRVVENLEYIAQCKGFKVGQSPSFL